MKGSKAMMFKQIVGKVAKSVVTLSLVAPLLAHANAGAIHLDKAPVNQTDYASLQRGARTFVNNCLSCHSATSMRYNRLQDIGLSEQQIKDNLLLAGEKVGDTMSVAMTRKDAAKWLGKAPPDLSVTARAWGADWLYTYLRTFYRDDTRPTGWNNVVFDKVGMPHVLTEYQGEQVLDHKTGKLSLAKPGTMNAKEYDAMVGDLVNYMVFMGEPANVKRQQLGYIVILFLSLILLPLAYLLKKEYWKDVH